MKIKNLLFAFVIFFYNCNSSEKNAIIKNDDEIIGSWELLEVRTYDKNNLELDVQTRLKLGKQLKSKGLVLHFFPDSAYTKIEDSKITSGNWSYLNEKEVEYGDHRLNIESFELGEFGESILGTIHTKTTASEVTLGEGEENLKNYKEDPFYPDNNMWRLKPLKKETNKEISARLSNYILHNAYVLKAAHTRNGGSVTFKNSQGIIRIYQGAIGILKENKIKASWINTYYDKEDAMKAYYLYKSYLGKENVYKIKSTGDWVKDDYEILFKLYNLIQNTKEEESDRFQK